jgi:hypothetical protein
MVKFYGRASISEEQAARHIEHTKTLGLPRAEDTLLHDRPLAVLGGGPSINSTVETLRCWPGDIWAINGAFNWCVVQQLNATYVSADPQPLVGDARLGPEDSALLAEVCDPSVWERLGHARITTFEMSFKTGVGPSTATYCLGLGPKLGYRQLTYFGCEGSFVEQRHAYDAPQDYMGAMVVRVGGEEFTTSPALLIQSEVLASLIRKFPEVYREQSGGLLSALVEHGKWEPVSVDPSLQPRERERGDFEYHGGMCPFDEPLFEPASPLEYQASK